MRTDAAKLVHGGKSSEYRVVAHMHVPRELGVVGKDGMVAYLAVVRHVRVRHDPVVITEPGHTGVQRRPAIERAEFANGIVVSDFEPRWLAAVFLVLRRFTQGHELIDPIIGAETRVSG